MYRRILSLLLLVCLFASFLTGCRQPKTNEAEPSVVPTAAPQATEAPTAEPTAEPTEAPTAEPVEENTTEQSYRFADREETADLLLSERDYYENMSQNDLNYRLQKTDATLEELEAYVRTQTLDFSEEEKAAIDGAMQFFLAECESRGYHLPPLEDVVFCKTTMHEESDAGAYTHGTHVFFGEGIMSYALNQDENMQTYFRYLFVHELFHCLTRNNPDFRADIYEILGFTVVEEDYVFPPEIKNQIISNPDVEHHNSYAAFLIDGVLRNCVVVFTADPFEKPGDSFFNTMRTGLVPIDTLDEMIASEEATNFWDVFGRNTSYVIDPEETLADNFGMLIVYGKNLQYPTPELINGIDSYLKKR